MGQASPTSPIPAPAGPWYARLYPQVIAAIVGGIVVGLIWPGFGASLQPLGEGFVKLVKMIIAPVIFLTIVTGIGGLQQASQIGRVAGRAFGYFLAVSSLALVVGLVVANVVQPGAGMNIAVSSLDAGAVRGFAAKAHEATITGFLLAIIPTTVLSALTDGSILQVLLVAILCGVALVTSGPAAAPVLRGAEALSQVVFRMVAILMRAAPIGAFGAMAFTVGKYGPEALLHLGKLVATFYLTSALFVVLVLGTIARLAGFSILALIRYLKEELLLVLGTSSSEAALPALMQKLEQAGCAKPVVGLVIPTGYSFNLDGTNIYMTLAALFIAQATGVDLSLGDQVALLLVAMVSSKGAAGVTGAGFITLAATLSITPSVPVAGMALILGVDRFMSECRALTNCIGNAVAAIVIAGWERALDRDRLAAALGGRATALSDPAAIDAAPAVTSPIVTPPSQPIQTGRIHPDQAPAE
ncbi:C4-dicarboxylate transporter DctA [Novosphingobium aerophilum]|uniref:C4-dicarboxylate transporter DctA n=1 Tax=Novosphingobium aerophilum TaxID=2839843 RepID=A0A7X1F4H2_9SPHN|nr:C4-dicarboxylate transporter DctA [Novosphingobium aerophilum]